MNTAALSAELGRLAAIPGVRLAVAAALNEGLVVQAAGEEARGADAVAALFAALFRKTAAVAEQVGLGEPVIVRVQRGSEQVLAAAAGGMVLSTVLGADANPGRVRLELLRAVEAVQ